MTTTLSSGFKRFFPSWTIVFTSSPLWAEIFHSFLMSLEKMADLMRLTWLKTSDGNGVHRSSLRNFPCHFRVSTFPPVRLLDSRVLLYPARQRSSCRSNRQAGFSASTALIRKSTAHRASRAWQHWGLWPLLESLRWPQGHTDCGLLRYCVATNQSGYGCPGRVDFSFRNDPSHHCRALI